MLIMMLLQRALNTKIHSNNQGVWENFQTSYMKILVHESHAQRWQDLVSIFDIFVQEFHYKNFSIRISL